MKKIVGSTLDLSTRAVFSLDKYRLINIGWKICFCLRNRFLFPVICGSINHWLEVSRQGDISRARSASDIYTDGWPTTSDLLSHKSTETRIYFDSNTLNPFKTDPLINFSIIRIDSPFDHMLGIDQWEACSVTMMIHSILCTPANALRVNKRKWTKTLTNV